MAKRKKKQGEFSNLPERDIVGKKAIDYLDARDTLEEAKEKLDTVKKELIKLFMEVGKTSVQIEGRTIFYSHLETDQIKVKQAE